MQQIANKPPIYHCYNFRLINLWLLSQEFFNFLKRTDSQRNFLLPYEDEIQDFDDHFRTPEVHKSSVLRAHLFGSNHIDSNELLILINRAINIIWENILEPKTDPPLCPRAAETIYIFSNSIAISVDLQFLVNFVAYFLTHIWEQITRTTQSIEQQASDPGVTDAGPIWNAEYWEQKGRPVHWIRPWGSINKFYHAVWIRFTGLSISVRLQYHRFDPWSSMFNSNTPKDQRLRAF